eukprot:g3238.t1
MRSMALRFTILALAAGGALGGFSGDVTVSSDGDAYLIANPGTGNAEVTLQLTLNTGTVAANDKLFLLAGATSCPTYSDSVFAKGGGNLNDASSTPSNNDGATTEGATLYTTTAPQVSEAVAVPQPFNANSAVTFKMPSNQAYYDRRYIMCYYDIDQMGSDESLHLSAVNAATGAATGTYTAGAGGTLGLTANTGTGTGLGISFDITNGVGVTAITITASGSNYAVGETITTGAISNGAGGTVAGMSFTLQNFHVTGSGGVVHNNADDTTDNTGLTVFLTSVDAARVASADNSLTDKPVLFKAAATPVSFAQTPNQFDDNAAGGNPDRLRWVEASTACSTADATKKSTDLDIVKATWNSGVYSPTFNMNGVGDAELHKVFRLCLQDYDTTHGSYVWYDFQHVTALYSDIAVIDPANPSSPATAAGAGVGIRYPRTANGATAAVTLSFYSADTTNVAATDKLQVRLMTDTNPCSFTENAAAAGRSDASAYGGAKAATAVTHTFDLASVDAGNIGKRFKLCFHEAGSSQAFAFPLANARFFLHDLDLFYTTNRGDSLFAVPNGGTVAGGSLAPSHKWFKSDTTTHEATNDKVQFVSIDQACDATGQAAGAYRTDSPAVAAQPNAGVLGDTAAVDFSSITTLNNNRRYRVCYHDTPTGNAAQTGAEAFSIYEEELFVTDLALKRTVGIFADAAANRPKRFYVTSASTNNADDSLVANAWNSDRLALVLYSELCGTTAAGKFTAAVAPAQAKDRAGNFVTTPTNELSVDVDLSGSATVNDATNQRWRICMTDNSASTVPGKGNKVFALTHQEVFVTDVAVSDSGTYTGLTHDGVNVVDSRNGGAVFAVTVNTASTAYAVTVTTPGTGYLNGDTITILGTSLGGATTANDLVITVGSESGDAALQDAECTVPTAGAAGNTPIAHTFQSLVAIGKTSGTTAEVTAQNTAQKMLVLSGFVKSLGLAATGLNGDKLQWLVGKDNQAGPPETSKACDFASATATTDRTDAVAIAAAGPANDINNMVFDTSGIAATNLNERFKLCLHDAKPVSHAHLADKAFEITSTIDVAVDATVDADIGKLVTPHELLITDMRLPTQRSAYAAAAQKITFDLGTAGSYATSFGTATKIQFVAEQTAPDPTAASAATDPDHDPSYLCPPYGTNAKDGTNGQYTDAVAFSGVDLHTSQELSFDFSGMHADHTNELWKVCVKQTDTAADHLDYYQTYPKVFDATLATKPIVDKFHAGGVFLTDITLTENAVLEMERQRLRLNSTRTGTVNLHAEDAWMFIIEKGPNNHCPTEYATSTFPNTKNAEATGAHVVGTDATDWSVGITAVDKTIYDFSDVNLVRSVFKMCLYRKPEERIYTVDVVNTHVCHLSPNYRHGGHDNTQCRACPCGSYEDNTDLGLCLDGESRTADTNWVNQKQHSCLATFATCSTCLCNHAEASSRDDPELALRQLYENLATFHIPGNTNVNANPDHWPNGEFVRFNKEYEIINNDRQEANRGSVNNAWRR